jgi:hypothetical protein
MKIRLLLNLVLYLDEITRGFLERGAKLEKLLTQAQYVSFRY